MHGEERGGGEVLGLFRRWKKPISFRAAQQVLHSSRSPPTNLTRIWLCGESYSGGGKGKKDLKTRRRKDPQGLTPWELVELTFVNVSMCRYLYENQNSIRRKILVAVFCNPQICFILFWILHLLAGTKKSVFYFCNSGFEYNERHLEIKFCIGLGQG